MFFQLIHVLLVPLQSSPVRLVLPQPSSVPLRVLFPVAEAAVLLAFSATVRVAVVPVVALVFLVLPQPSSVPLRAKFTRFETVTSPH